MPSQTLHHYSSALALLMAVQIIFATAASSCPQWSLRDLVHLSPTIVEATVVSHSQIDLGPTFHVTFKVRKVWKTSEEDVQKSNQLIHNSYLKLDFISQQKSQAFGRLEPIVSPLRRTRRAKKALKKALCRELHQYCHQNKHAKSLLQDSSQVRRRAVELGQKMVRLNCQISAAEKRRPHTKAQFGQHYWFKNGRQLQNSPNMSIFKNKRSNSVLKIRHFQPEDVGQYECRNSRGYALATYAVTLAKRRKLKPPDSASSIMDGQQCPMDTFCLNGGTCRFFQAIGELSCECAAGFYGQRCEYKGVDHRNVLLRRHTSSKCVLGLTHYPC